MTVEVLVSAMHQAGMELAEKMNLQTDAVIVNQCEQFAFETFLYKGATIRQFSCAERGVGLSRNTALMRGRGDILLFSDEDIRYVDGYEKIILDAFDANPDADGMTFNVTVDPRRKTYENTAEGRIRFYNYGRYPTYALAVKREAIRRAGVCFSLLFGGGASYSNGEDSLFFHDCLKKGLHLYTSPKKIGAEEYRESTWFTGYHEKFFFDRGVLYPYLYGCMAYPMALRFLLSKRKVMCGEIGVSKALKMMKQGIREGRDIRGKKGR